MTLEKRVEKLEKRTGGRDDEQITIMVLYRGDRAPTEDEKAAAIARHPERTMVILHWNGQSFESAIP